MVPCGSSTGARVVDTPRHPGFDFILGALCIRFDIRFGENAYEEHHGVWTCRYSRIRPLVNDIPFNQ